MKGRIENYIPVGRENKISRESLTMCTGLTDRVVAVARQSWATRLAATTWQRPRQT